MQKKKSFHSTKYINFLSLLFVGIILFMPRTTFAVSPTLADDSMPVKINSNDMVYDMDGNTVVFTGNVVVIRGEFIMKSPQMQIFMKEKGKKEKASEEEIMAPPKNMPLTGAIASSQAPTEDNKAKNQKNDIERIEAYQGVVFDYGTQSGSSESAIYDAQKGLLTMRGNPVVREGENSIQGDLILYYVNERRSEVIGSEKQRVEATFNNNN